MSNAELVSVKKVHFVGIGGIGVSAIARMMLLRGAEVSGSDATHSQITGELEHLGAEIFYGHRKEQVPEEADLVVYTAAAPQDNPELEAARERGIPLLSYPEMLGLLSRDYETIAVSGTHGKTTTTAMVAKVLLEAGLDPTVIVGSLLKDTHSNFVAGESKYLVVEACEYRKHFLSLFPSILVITNIDDDHLDYFQTLQGVTEAFGELARKVPAAGAIICDPSDSCVKEALRGASARVVDYTAVETDTLSLRVPGEHNKRNAACALAVAELLGVEAGVARKALSEFSGTWRRFEFKGKTADGVIVYDDYAHHPTEIRVTLAAAREAFPKAHLTVAFQPHLYSRTKLLLSKFAGAFEGADRVVFAPIYAAREAFDPSISSQMLAEQVLERGIEARSLSGFDEITHFLEENTPTGGIIITMGAGDIFKVGEQLVVH